MNRNMYVIRAVHGFARNRELSFVWIKVDKRNKKFFLTSFLFRLATFLDMIKAVHIKNCETVKEAKLRKA